MKVNEAPCAVNPIKESKKIVIIDYPVEHIRIEDPENEQSV